MPCDTMYMYVYSVYVYMHYVHYVHCVHCVHCVHYVHYVHYVYYVYYVYSVYYVYNVYYAYYVHVWMCIFVLMLQVPNTVAKASEGLAMDTAQPLGAILYFFGGLKGGRGGGAFISLILGCVPLILTALLVVPPPFLNPC